MTVSIRRATLADAGFIADVYADEDVRPFLAASGRYDGAAVQEQIERWEAAPDAGGVMVIESEGVPAGVSMWWRVNERSRIAHLGGLAVHPGFRGARISDEAARMLQRWLVFELGFHRLELEVYSFNERAQRHAERAGFVREGVKRRAYRRGDDWVDGICYALVEEDLEPDRDRKAPVSTQAARHLTTEELEAGLEEILRAPRQVGSIELIVRRPAVDEREVLEEATLDLDEGLVGDTWRVRGSKRTDDGSSHPDMQLNVMSARVVDLVAGGERDRWALAGDQLYVDLDLSEAHLPPGTRLALGTAVIEVTEQPHTGCAKFSARFGGDAHRFVNTKQHRHLRLRGLNAKVVVPGTVRAGDEIRTL